jgi:protein SCO1/2
MKLRLAITLAVFVAASILAFRGDLHAGRVGGAAKAASFELIDAKSGKPFTDRNLRGQPAALFFGFTHCPDVCPTALITAGRWLKALGPDADKLRFVFVSVDPERDTQDALALYLRSFDPRIIGLTGSRAQTDQMIKHYGVVAIKRESSDNDYAYDHTSLIQLFDSEGELAGTVDFDDPSETALAKLRALD